MNESIVLNFGGFIICAILIFVIGKRLTKYGDMISEISGMGNAWVGLVLMATVTSLPEMMVGISSTAIVESADLAVGDVLGSCAFNLGILSFMDVFTPRKHPLFSSASKSSILAAGFGIILLAMTGLGLYLEKEIVVLPSIAMTSLLFAVGYIFSVRTLFLYEKTHIEEVPVHETGELKLSPKRVILIFAAYAIVLIAVALVLPYFANKIADETGLETTFVGTLFLAITTSLPEIAVSLSAIRMGLGNMAVGNLLGSNIFNIFILFIDDIFYSKGLLLKDASDTHLISVFSVILMSAVAILGFVFPFKEKRIFMGWDTLTIFMIYIMNVFLLYLVLQ